MFTRNPLSRAMLCGLLAMGAPAPAMFRAERDLDDPSVALRRGRIEVDGRPFTGALVSRYANGQLTTRRLYRRGRENGVHLGWWEDGTVHFVYRYVAGVLEGEAREWYRSGSRYREFHYRDGHEEGVQQMWNTDGSVRASYEVRDGRRFGIQGAKGCTGTMAGSAP